MMVEVVLMTDDVTTNLAEAFDVAVIGGGGAGLSAEDTQWAIVEYRNGNADSPKRITASAS